MSAASGEIEMCLGLFSVFQMARIAHVALTMQRLLAVLILISSTAGTVSAGWFGSKHKCSLKYSSVGQIVEDLRADKVRQTAA